MRVFVTGASGFIGSAIVSELVSAGHEVTGLVRSAAGAATVEERGAAAYRGTIDEIDGIRDAVDRADGVIHTAFNHDFSAYKAHCEADRRVVEAIGAMLAGSDRPLVVTSGVGILPPGRLLTEHVPPPPASVSPRAASEEGARAVADRGGRVSIVRLPPSVHDDGDHGFVPMIIAAARDKRQAVFVGEGENRWPAVHRSDAARLYRLALERGTAGTCYHAVAEEGVPFRAIVEVIGRRLAVPVVSQTYEEAAHHYGWLTHFAAVDVPSSSRRTREALGWEPSGPGLMADLDRDGGYFA